MRRRALLAAVAGASSLTGCSSVVDSPGDRSGDTLTPAPVGTAGERGVRTATPAPCPELPTNAEVYVCSRSKTDGLRLDGVADEGAERTALRLENPTSLSFNTGPDWWTLARRLPETTDDDWGIAAQGDGAGRLRLGPDESFVWLFGPPATTEATFDAALGSLRVGARPAPGRYVFSVVGYFGGGELTAVMGPFVVRPDGSMSLPASMEGSIAEG